LFPFLLLVYKGVTDYSGIYYGLFWLILLLLYFILNKTSSPRKSKNIEKKNDSRNIISDNSPKVVKSTRKQADIFPKLAKYKVNYLYHMTHINNLSSIFRQGLVSNHKAHSSQIVNKDISDPDVQQRRERIDPIYNLSIHSYVPLYFNPRNPMLFVRKKMQKSIALLVFDANSIFYRKGVIFSDGNAASNPTKFYSSLNDLNKLDWNCIYAASYWNDFSDGKRKRCAEVLVPNKIEFNKVVKILVYDYNAINQVKSRINNYQVEVVKDDQFFF